MNETNTLVFHFNGGHFELLEYGKWTLSSYAAHFLSAYIYEDKEGNTVDKNGHFLFSKEDENNNSGCFAFDDYADGYIFVPVDELADSGNERCFDCFERELLQGRPCAEQAYDDLKSAAQKGDSASQIIVDILNF